MLKENLSVFQDDKEGNGKAEKEILLGLLRKKLTFYFKYLMYRDSVLVIPQR